MNGYKMIVKGLVQGVYYRKTIHNFAIKNGFTGYVKNLPNGDVEVGVLLDESEYKDFIAILKRGSPSSRVDSIEVTTSNEQFTTFEIRY